MKIKNLFIFLILIIELGCASPIERVNEIKPETEKNSLTVGKVQQTIKKGMTQTEVVEALGSPNMVTKDKENIESEIIDRFGKIPETVSSLIEIALLKNKCQYLGIGKIEAINEGLVISFYNDKLF